MRTAPIAFALLLAACSYPADEFRVDSGLQWHDCSLWDENGSCDVQAAECLQREVRARCSLPTFVHHKSSDGELNYWIYAMPDNGACRIVQFADEGGGVVKSECTGVEIKSTDTCDKHAAGTGCKVVDL